MIISSLFIYDIIVIFVFITVLKTNEKGSSF